MALTVAGLTIKRADDVRQDLADAIQAPTGLGPGASVRANGPLGKIIGIVSTAIGLVWEALQMVYDAFDPDQATGEALDNVAGLVGVTRLAATKTSGTITAFGTDTTVIPLGSIVRIPSGARFLTTAAATIGSVTPGEVDIPVEAEFAGPIEAAANTITEIVTIIAGWTSVDNANALVTGRDDETDADLRLRREASLQIIGAGTDGAIQSRLAGDADIGALAVIVRSNRTLVTDSDGIPGKAFEVVLHPSTLDTTLIATAIFEVMPAGILPFGLDVTALVTDSQGFDQTIMWSWASIQDVFVDVILTNDDTYPLDGDQQVEDAVVEVSDGYNVGNDVSILELLCAVAEIQGVKTVVIEAKVGSAPGPSDIVDIVMTFRQLARIQAANITVTSTPV